MPEDRPMTKKEYISVNEDPSSIFNKMREDARIASQDLKAQMSKSLKVSEDSSKTLNKTLNDNVKQSVESSSTSSEAIIKATENAAATQVKALEESSEAIKKENKKKPGTIRKASREAKSGFLESMKSDLAGGEFNIGKLLSSAKDSALQNFKKTTGESLSKRFFKDKEEDEEEDEPTTSLKKIKDDAKDKVSEKIKKKVKDKVIKPTSKPKSRLGSFKGKPKIPKLGSKPGMKGLTNLLSKAGPMMAIALPFLIVAAVAGGAALLIRSKLKDIGKSWDEARLSKEKASELEADLRTSSAKGAKVSEVKLKKLGVDGKSIIKDLKSGKMSEEEALKQIKTPEQEKEFKKYLADKIRKNKTLTASARDKFAKDFEEEKGFFSDKVDGMEQDEYIEKQMMMQGKFKEKEKDNERLTTVLRNLRDKKIEDKESKKTFKMIKDGIETNISEEEYKAAQKNIRSQARNSIIKKDEARQRASLVNPNATSTENTKPIKVVTNYTLIPGQQALPTSSANSDDGI